MINTAEEGLVQAPVAGRPEMEITIAWRTERGSVVVAADHEGARHEASGLGLDEALRALARALPPGAMPRLCGLCRLGLSDPYGASDGFGLSCYRGHGDLAAAITAQGRAAPPEAFALMGGVRVTADGGCEGFEAAAGLG